MDLGKWEASKPRPAMAFHQQPPTLSAQPSTTLNSTPLQRPLSLARRPPLRPQAEPQSPQSLTLSARALCPVPQGVYLTVLQSKRAQSPFVHYHAEKKDAIKTNIQVFVGLWRVQ